MRRFSIGCCIRWSTRARASWRRESPCAPATSTWCTYTVTGFRHTREAPCTGRGKRAVRAWSRPCSVLRPRTVPAGDRRRSSSTWRPRERTGTMRTRRRQHITAPEHLSGGLMRSVFAVAVVASCLVAGGVACADSPAGEQAMPHVPGSVAEWARGARLFEGLGNFHRKVSTSSDPAQQYFDQGMRLLWAFNHDESSRSFAKAAELDPACAACYWGVALTVGPNYNVPAMEEPRARVAWEALHQAQENAAQTSAVEQALTG